MYPFTIPARENSLTDFIIIRDEDKIKTNKNAFIIKKSTAKPQDQLDMKNSLSYLKSVKVVSSYIDYLDQINQLLSLKIRVNFYVFYDLKSIYTFYNFNTSLNVNLLCKYRDSNKQVFEYMKKLAGLSYDVHFVQLEANPDNNFSFITSPQILNLLCVKEDILSRGEELFSKFKITSKNGKVRDIVAPHDDIKIALRELNELLQRVYDKRNANFQIAYKKKKNVKSGAKLHVNHKFVYNIDLHDFYPSCKKELVKRYTDFLFSYSFNRTFIEEEFFSVILMDNGLFIGSPISGTLANAIISNPIKYMKNMCKKFDIELSVYADDITFSSDKFIAKDFVLKLFNEAFSKYKLTDYFELNEKKCKGFSGMHRKITGVAINESDKITVPRRYYRSLRASMDHLAKGDLNVNIQKLRGQIAYATMIDESGKIYNFLMKNKAVIDQYKLCSDEKIAGLPR